jgi:hypothetical protein
MDESVEVEIVVDSVAYLFDVYLSNVGFVHKIHVLIEGIEVVYEPDEERNYRAIVSEADRFRVTPRHTALIHTLGEKLQIIHGSL